MILLIIMWGKGCISHNAYVEVYGEESSPKKDKEKHDKN